MPIIPLPGGSAIAVAFVLAGIFLPGPVFAADAPPPGHTRQLVVGRVTTPPQIDGFLEPIWADAHVAQDFWISDYRRSPAEPTEVLVLADDRALYFAITCYDSNPERIQADQIQRDQSMGLDDRVTVELDPYHNHRLISTFSVNARGTQADAMAGGRGRQIGWKGDWQGAAIRTGYGWIAEIAIPFDILEFDAANTVFGINFVRFHSRTQEFSRWADVTPQALAEEAGHLVDLKLPTISRATRLAAMPYASGGLNTVNRDGEVRKWSATTGLDVRLDMAQNVRSVVTVNPDFRQVEDTVLDLAFDYNEKFRRDPRPFFQEGAGFFGSRTYFHSGRIADFLVGGKAFGKAGGYQFAALAVSDHANERRDYVGALTREIGQTASAGFTVVETDRPDFSNTLLAAQTGGRIGRVTFGFNAARSQTDGRPGNGVRTAASLGYRGPYFLLTASGERTEADFFPADGFIAADTLGTQAASLKAAFDRGFARGWLRRVGVEAEFGGRRTLDDRLQREQLSLYGNLETRSNIAIGVGATVGPYRPRSASNGGWSDVLYDDRFYTATISQYQSNDRSGYGLTFSWGFLADGEYQDLAPYVWWKPTPRTSVSYSYERAHSFGLSQQHILSASWDVSGQDTLSGRWVQDDTAGFYRLAYGHVVRRGVDVFAVFNHDPLRRHELTAKVVWTLNVARQIDKP